MDEEDQVIYFYFYYISYLFLVVSGRTKDAKDICIIIITATLIITEIIMFTIIIIINQVLEHEHLDTGHSHSYNAARHAGVLLIIMMIMDIRVLMITKTIIKRMMMRMIMMVKIITGYPANFCSASNNCNDKSGFDHYNQWPTSKVIMIIMRMIMMTIMMTTIN